MRFQESRIERAERRLREAEANVERQKRKLAELEAKGDRTAYRCAREVLQAFRDAAMTMRLRVRELRRLHLSNREPLPS